MMRLPILSYNVGTGSDRHKQIDIDIAFKPETNKPDEHEAAAIRLWAAQAAPVCPVPPTGIQPFPFALQDFFPGVHMDETTFPKRFAFGQPGAMQALHFEIDTRKS